MDKLVTKDGSETFFNETYKDYYHSTAGAVSEAVIKYVIPCRIEELARQREVFLLDIGFGLGYTLGTAIDAVEKAGGRMTAVTLEKHPEPLSGILEVAPSIRNFQVLKELAKAGNFKDDRFNLRLIRGDATKTIREIELRFDAVFHDPFAPTRNTELWTREFFEDVRKLMKPGAILATYSCARHVRDNMKAAGLIVGDGPVFGRRGPSTVATNPIIQ
jgi:tRNA U34 5-methylaminomethyl-2-thiouridine-forming methyltransferase MnmC